jgi:glutamate-1-semialdehyde 2,1-aminomutase
MTDRTPSNAPGTRRVLPAESKPVDPGRVQQLLASEWERFVS